jgi:hypothetical protein
MSAGDGARGFKSQGSEFRVQGLGLEGGGRAQDRILRLTPRRKDAKKGEIDQFLPDVWKRVDELSVERCYLSRFMPPTRNSTQLSPKVCENSCGN